MTIIKGYKELPEICYCDYCGEEYGRWERDIKTLYKQVDDNIFTVAVCHDCIQLLKQRGELVGIQDKNKITSPPSFIRYEFTGFRIKLG